jgi:low temperature requirement protein LtrA
VAVAGSGEDEPMSAEVGGSRPWRRQMVARDRGERHRASTPLELLFDLCFVVAVAQAAAQLHHSLATGEVGGGVLGYAMVFFAIWWAWVNFTWFASAYDTDDVPYRLFTLLQIAGVLVLAAGVPAAMARFDFTTMTIGYVIMRVALIAQWLRAARDYPPGRPGAYRYAAGVAACQVGWVLRLLLPEPWGTIAFVVLALAELSVPVWAEYRGRRTSWHPEHINERYGLFTLIVLGECVSAVTLAAQSAISDHGVSPTLLVLAFGALLLVFGLWWSYFKHEVTEGLRESLRTTMVWAYSHYAVFAAVAALGAGLEVAIEAVEHTEISPLAAGYAVAVPVAIYLVVAGAIHGRLSQGQYLGLGWIVGTAVLVLLAAASAGLIGVAGVVAVIGVLVALLVAVNLVAAHRRTAAARQNTA